MRVISINAAAEMSALSALAHNHDARLIENRRSREGAIGAHQLHAIKDRRPHPLSRGERDQALSHSPVADF